MWQPAGLQRAQVPQQRAGGSHSGSIGVFQAESIQRRHLELPHQVVARHRGVLRAVAAEDEAHLKGSGGGAVQPRADLQRGRRQGIGIRAAAAAATGQPGQPDAQHDHAQQPRQQVRGA